MRFTDTTCSREITAPPVEPVARRMPDDPRLRALCRPSDYGDLTPHMKRQIDRELNLLDWMA